MAVFVIYFQTYQDQGQDENTGDAGLVEEVLGIYFFVSHCVRHIEPSVSRHCSLQTERASSL